MRREGKSKLVVKDGKIVTERKARWLYISFTDENKQFVGVVMVQDGIGPYNTPMWVVNGLPWKGQAAIYEIPTAQVPEDHKYHDRLLDKGELREAVGPLVNAAGEPR